MELLKNDFITIKIGRNRYRKVFLENILYCKADRSYSLIKTFDAEYSFSETLKSIEDLFENHNYYLRVNRSYIINLTNCIELKIGTKPELILKNGEIVHPNDAYITEIMAFFKISKTE